MLFFGRFFLFRRLNGTAYVHRRNRRERVAVLLYLLDAEFVDLAEESHQRLTGQMMEQEFESSRLISKLASERLIGRISTTAVSAMNFPHSHANRSGA